MLVRIKENAEKYRDPIGRKMRADAPVLVAGLLHSRGLRQKKTPSFMPVGVINYCLSQGKYGDNLRAVVMHNDEEQPHLHFSYAPIPKLMPRHYITDTRQKEFHSSIQGVPRRLSRPSRDPLRNGPPRAKEATPDTRRVEGTKKSTL